MSVRLAIRRRLIEAVPSVQGRVFEMSAAQPTTAYPFLVMKGGPEDLGVVWGNVDQPFEIWPYVAAVTSRDGLTPYGALDVLIAEIEAAFGGRDGYWFVDQGVPYVGHWLGGAADDFQDQQWQGAHTRPQRIEVAALTWLIFSHPVLAALRDWTDGFFATWVTDPAGVSPSNTRPWVFWRFSSLPVRGEALTMDLTWQDATVAAHVVVPGASSRVDAASRLAFAIGNAGDCDPPVIAMPDGSWLQITAVRANPDTDPRTQGQVLIDIRYLATPDVQSDDVFDNAILYGPPIRVSHGAST